MANNINEKAVLINAKGATIIHLRKRQMDKCEKRLSSVAERLFREEDVTVFAEEIDYCPGGPEACGLKKGLNLGCKGLIYLHNSETRLQSGSDFGEGPIEKQRVLIRNEERKARFMVKDVHTHLGSLKLAHIGRVAEEDVAWAGHVGKAIDIEDVMFEEGRPVREVKRLGRGNGEGVVRYVDGRHCRLRALGCHGPGNAAGSGAEVEDAAWGVLDLGDGFMDKELSLLARDEDGGSDMEPAAIEVRAAEDVLEGLAFSEAVHI